MVTKVDGSLGEVSAVVEHSRSYGLMSITAEDTTLTGDEAGTPPGDRRFRPDVQGLRAVAVVLVVLFHANIPGLRGGYVGVDVFFVISGFVITGFLLRERARVGSTSLLHFYTRRIRRILPAASLVIIASVIAAYAFLGSVSGNQNAIDARWASVFLINVHFAATGTNYLASQAPPSVLQNYWSLAVEEQFYLLYPAIFLVVVGISLRSSLRRRIGLVLGVAIVVSFVWSILQTSNNPTAAFFSPLPRVWELALGGLVAVSTVQLRRLPAAVASALSWLGLGAILLASVVFSAATPYPGWRVALPVCGAALVIAGGTVNPTHGVERLLAQRPFQWIGLISFSLYLWHWPVLEIATQRRGVATPANVGQRLAAPRLSGAGGADVSVPRESCAAQQILSLETLGQPHSRGMPHCRDPHRCHRGAQPASGRGTRQ